jgi:hypothetical protein
MAEKDRLIPQVGPVDRLLPSQLMSLRQGHQDALAPQRQGIAVKDVSPSVSMTTSIAPLRKAVTRRIRDLSTMPSAICGHRCLKSTNVARKLPADSDV